MIAFRFQKREQGIGDLDRDFCAGLWKKIRAGAFCRNLIFY